MTKEEKILNKIIDKISKKTKGWNKKLSQEAKVVKAAYNLGLAEGIGICEEELKLLKKK